MISKERLASVVVAAVVMWQTGSKLTLDELVARAPDPYSKIAGVRELKDGTLIVLDGRDLSLHAVSFVARSSRSIGRSGGGPGEYLAPFKLVPLPGDSAALIDAAARSKLLVITPTAELKGTIRMPQLEGISYPDWSDSRRRFYSAIPRVTGNQVNQDSALVLRWDEGGRVDTVAKFRMRATSGVARSSGPVVQTPFATHDEWVVSPDGRVAVVSPKPFRVTFFEVDGRVKVGPLLTDEAVRVSEEDKREWRELAQRPMLALTSSRGGPLSVTWLKPSFREPKDWPKYLPPFPRGGVRFAPDGLLWVERSTPSGVGPLIDVIDPNGYLITRIELPARTRLLGFGSRSVYLARRDQNDLEWLEKYRLPVIRR